MSTEIKYETSELKEKHFQSEPLKILLLDVIHPIIPI